MNINFNPTGQNNFLNVHRINQSIARQNGNEIGNQTGKTGRSDAASMSTDFKQAQTVSSVKTGIEGETHVLKSEIKLDKMRASASDSAKERISQKESELARWEQRSTDLSSTIADKIADTSEKMDENSKLQEVAEETDKEQME